MREVLEFGGPAGLFVPGPHDYADAVKCGSADVVAHLEREHALGMTTEDVAECCREVNEYCRRFTTADHRRKDEVLAYIRHAVDRAGPAAAGSDVEWAELLSAAALFGPPDLAPRVLRARPDLVPSPDDLTAAARRGFVDAALEISRRLTLAGVHGVAGLVPETAAAHVREMLAD